MCLLFARLEFVFFPFFFWYSVVVFIRNSSNPPTPSCGWSPPTPPSADPRSSLLRPTLRSIDTRLSFVPPPPTCPGLYAFLVPFLGSGFLIPFLSFSSASEPMLCLSSLFFPFSKSARATVLQRSSYPHSHLMCLFAFGVFGVSMET